MGACPSVRVLDSIARGAAVEESVVAHVATCSECSQLLVDMRANEEFLRGAAPILAPGTDHTRTTQDEGERFRRPDLSPGDVAGYDLIEEIGRGGQGVVFRAVQKATKRPAAVKMLMAGLFATERQQRRFEREVEIAARLRHPNLVTVFESGVSSRGNPYVAMEYVAGVPINQYVESSLGAAGASGAGRASGRASGRARVDAVMRLMSQVVSGVAHAHVGGIIHRDVKPSNILVDGAGHPRVLDFGLARETETGQKMPTTREFVGTPAFAAPEQFAGDGVSVNARADVYALGLVMYTLLTGQHPYPCDGTVAELARHAVETEPTPPSKYVRGLPSDVETIVLKCLSKEPVRRYASAVPLASDIEDYLTGRAISARRDSAAYVLRKLAMRNRVPALAVLLVLITAFGAAVGLALLARDLDRARRQAEAALGESDVQRARLMVMTGNTEEAESLLWKHALGNEASGAALCGDVNAESRRSAWTLAELYARVPRRFRAEFVSVAECGVDSGSGEVWAMDRFGTRRRWSCDGAMLETVLVSELPDGAELAAGSEGGRFAVYQSAKAMLVYDFQTRSVVSGPVEFPQEQRARAIADDGSCFVTIRDKSGQSAIIDARSMLEIARLDSDAMTVHFARPPEGLTLLIGARKAPRPRLVVRRAPDWRIIHEWPIESAWSETAVGLISPRLSDDGRRATASVLESVLVFDRDPGVSAVPTMMNDGGVVISTAFADHGRTIAAALQSSMISVFDRSDARVIERIPTPGRPTSQRALGAGHGLFAYASISGDLCVYDAPESSWRGGIAASTSTHASVAFASDGTYAWADDGGNIVIRHANGSGEDTVITKAHTGPITAINFAPDASRFVSTGHDGSVKVWSVRGTLERTMVMKAGVIAPAVFSPDGRFVAAAADSGTIWVWRSEDGSAVLVRTASKQRHPDIAFSQDSTRLACGAIDERAFVIDIATGGVSLFGAVGRSRAVAWSPDGRTLAIGSDDNTVRFWDASSGALLRSVKGLPWRLHDMVFHSSGRLLFAVGFGPEIVVIDPNAGTELAKLKVHERPIFSVAISPEGKRLMTAGQDSWIGVTDLDRLRTYVDGNEPYWIHRLSSEAGSASPSTSRPTNHP